MPLLLPSDQRFDYGLPPQLESGVVNLLNSLVPGIENVPALVSTPGNQPSATLAATVGTAGQVVRLSDGPDAGALLVWAIPQGASAYSWCWWLWPQSAY